MMTDDRLPIVVIGAGMAGLVAARQLQQVGYPVLVLEKSRGFGGRLNVRRSEGTCADRGVRYLEDQGGLTRALIHALHLRNLVRVWTGTPYHLEGESLLRSPVRSRYIAPKGITVAAKFLAQGLTVWLNHRAIALEPPTRADDPWVVRLDQPRPNLPGERRGQVLARAVVLALPAPQAGDLLAPLASQGLDDELLKAVTEVVFEPSYAVMAGYAADTPLTGGKLVDDWQSIGCVGDRDLAWVSRESTKYLDASQPTLLVQSSIAFAHHFLNATDLDAIAQHLLDRLASLTGLAFDQPAWTQVHRWRYGFARQPAESECLADRDWALVCCGDWCGGDRLETAMVSGLAAATVIDTRLDDRMVAPVPDWIAHPEP